jgi:hypothetical protein
LLESWRAIVDRILRPSRPQLALCVREGEAHLEARQRITGERARAIAECEALIEQARAKVFAADDGVVTWRMWDLERRWRRLSRSDPDDGLMDLWARIAPCAWTDRKRWRDATDDASRLETAIALASDVDGVEAAESAIGALRHALATWGARVGPRVRWSLFRADADATTDWLAGPLSVARAALAERGGGAAVESRALELEQGILEAALARCPERPVLARSIAHAALVDFSVLGAAQRA